MVDKIRSQEIVDTIHESLLILTEDLRVDFANRNFFETFRASAEATIGQPLFELGNGQWNIPALRDALEQVLAQGHAVESFLVEHAFPEIGWRAMRLNARKTYRAGNGSRRILVAVEDVTEAHEAARELERQRRLAQGIVDTIREPLLVLDGNLRVIAASRSFYAAFQVSEADTLGQELHTLGNGQWNIPRLSELLVQVIPDNATVEDFELEHEFETIGRRSMLLNARKIFREGNNTKTLLLAIEDITERRRIEREREAALQQTQVLLEELNHRVMNSLGIIAGIMALEAKHMTDSECRTAFTRVRTRVQAVSELYKALSGRGAVDTVQADEYLGTIAQDVLHSVDGVQRTPTRLDCEIAAVPLFTRTAVPLGLVLNELITNCMKYAFPKDVPEPAIHITFTEEADDFVLNVADNGKGIDPNARTDSGLGGRLTEAFSKQLDGRLTHVPTETGVRFQLRFPRIPAESEDEA